eukprot:scaffold3071_cov253-Pinguiococcus_pyrenoidosus.AAC.7
MVRRQFCTARAPRSSSFCRGASDRCVCTTTMDFSASWHRPLSTSRSASNADGLAILLFITCIFFSAPRSQSLGQCRGGQSRFGAALRISTLELKTKVEEARWPIRERRPSTLRRRRQRHKEAFAAR